LCEAFRRSFLIRKAGNLGLSEPVVWGIELVTVVFLVWIWDSKIFVGPACHEAQALNGHETNPTSLLKRGLKTGLIRNCELSFGIPSK
jgi:hypothetical protein